MLTKCNLHCNCYLMFFYQNQEDGSRGIANNQFHNSKNHFSAHPQTHQDTKLQSYHAIRFKEYQTVTLTNDGKYYQETDKNFVTDVQAIAKLNRNFILHLLKDRKEVKLDDHQCEELHHEATIHREANIVNTNSQIDFQKANEVYQCQCGCQKASGDLIPICCDSSSLKVLGSGINLFFIFQKGIVTNLLIAAIMFGIYTTLANLSGGNGPSTADQCNVQDTKCNFVNNSSAKNNLNDYLIKIEYLLGLILCTVWGFTLRLIRKFGHDKSYQIDDASKTSSDTAIQVTNLPFGQYCENDLKKYFESLYENEDKKWKKQNKFGSEETNYGIKSIQIVYNMQFCRELIKKIQDGCSEAAKLVTKKKQRDNLIPLDDYKKYKLCKTSIIQTYEIMSDLRKKFLNDEKFRKKISTTYSIIIFSKEQYAKAVTEKYGKDKIGFLKRIQYKLMKCCFPKTKNITFRGKVLVIERAPEPSDIIWLNCQKQYSTCRIMGILLITVAIIIVSFGLLLGLQYINNYYSGTNSGSSQVISLITTIALQVINKVLWIVLYFLLDLQYNYTMTEKIVSQMNKAMLAICFNVLVLPFIVYVSFKNQLYGSKGLAGFVFDYHITVITAGLALKFFNPVNLIIRLAICIKKIRNMIFRFMRKDYDSKENDLFRKRIHKLYEGEYFDVAEAYIFIMTNVFHATFFCHLCPSILFFALAEIFIYYWIIKIKLVRQFTIPESTELLVFDNALSLAYLVPIVYGMGSFFLSYKQALSSQTYLLNYIFQMIVIGMGAISYINPGNIFNILTQKMLACLACQSQDNKNVESKKREDIFEGSDIAFQNGPMQRQESEVETVKKTTEKCKEQEDINRKQQPNAKVERSQSYYRNSNCLKLLGFQHILKGKHESELKDQLKSYCQAFLSRQQDIQCMVEDFKRIMINNLIPVEVAQNIQTNSKEGENKKTINF